MKAEGKTSRGALEGLVVVDLTRVLAGPLCTQILADHGAQVTKIEPPTGDETRVLGPPFDKDGNASYYSALNRNKRAMGLNLADPQGRAVLERMIAGADILVENFLPGTMEGWGLGYEDVLALKNKRLIYCSISGFGADGPLGGLPGYDAVLQAMCGVMSVNGTQASGPTRVGVPIVDHLTGYVALVGILAALHARSSNGGRGQRVEATLFDTALSMLLPQGANWLASGRTPELLGSAHPNIAPYDKFPTQDGEIFLGIVNNGQFRRFCDYIGSPELASDPRFSTNGGRLQHRETLKTKIEEALRKISASQACQDLMAVGVPAGAVNSVPDALSQPHSKFRRVLVEHEGHFALRSPVRLYGTPGIQGWKAPLFGQDSIELLRELGYDNLEIDRLIRSGVVFPKRSP